MTIRSNKAESTNNVELNTIGQLALSGKLPPKQWKRLKDGQKHLQRIKRVIAALDGWKVDVDDPDAKDVLKRLERAWIRWTPEQVGLLLLAVKDIAKAEKAKQAWNPKEIRHRYTRLARSAISAARLAEEISSMFPSPWEGERAGVGALVTHLVSFVSGTLHASIPFDKHLAASMAYRAIHDVRRSLSRRDGETKWKLIRDLAWLASGKTILASERTIRRYLKKPRLSKSPASGHWERNWKLIQKAAGLAPGTLHEEFENAVKLYL